MVLASCGTGERDPVADAKFENEQRIGREDVTKRQEQDADFMVEAATGSRFGAELGLLAQRRGGSPALRSYGQQLAREQSSLSAALRTVGEQKNLAVPDALTQDQQETVSKLSGLSGAAFDQELLGTITEHLDDAHDAFDDMADDAYDGDIRAVAAKHAALLKTQRERADQLEEQLPR
ncbi:hypothetical protein GCM10027048_09590 [Hymenobacter coalescens]